jgi:protein-S-isoprenylcysteine O-methyltransferase Ste14
MQALELRIPPLVLVVIAAALMWLLAVLVPTASFSNAWNVHLALLPMISGVAIVLLGVAAFRRAGTTVDPRVPQQTSRVVSTGIYRRSRNPMYLGFLLVLFGWSLYLSNGLCFLLLPLFIAYMNRFQILPEERMMLEKFGAQYNTYMARVRRWI